MFLLILFFFLNSFASSSKILVYNPIFSHSHAAFMGRIAKTLEEEGHDVTVIAPVLFPPVEFDEKQFKKAKKIELSQETIDVTTRAMDDPFFWEGDHSSIFLIMHANKLANEGFYLACSSFLRKKALIQLLREEHFDFGITEYFDGCGLGLFYYIGLNNYALVSSAGMYDTLAEAIGLPTPTAYVPGLQSDVSASELADSMLSRLHNFAVTAASTSVLNQLIEGAQRAFDEIESEFPRLQALAMDASLILVNAEPLLNFPHPTLHKIVEIGGLGVPEPKEMDAEWSQVLSVRPRNVLISFGSVVRGSDMPAKMKEAIVETARRFPEVTFVWKYEESDDVGRGVENLVKAKWIPQNDLLNSGLISAFVTHAGMNSMQEAVRAGVPSVAIGLFFEQMRNAVVLTSHGVAIKLNKFDLQDAEKMENAIRKVLEDASFTRNARRMSSLLRARPFSARELLTRNVAFVASHGPLPSLSPASIRLSTFQLLFLDAIALFIGAVIAAMLSIALLCRRLMAYTRHAKKD